TLRASIMGSVIRVAVDGVEVIVWADPEPLPPGTVAFGPIFPPLPPDTPAEQHRLMVDDFVLAVPTAKLTDQLTATPSPLPTVSTPTAAPPTPTAVLLPPEPPLTPIFIDN